MRTFSLSSFTVSFSLRVDCSASILSVFIEALTRSFLLLRARLSSDKILTLLFNSLILLLIIFKLKWLSCSWISASLTCFLALSYSNSWCFLISSAAIFCSKKLCESLSKFWMRLDLVVLSISI